MAQQWQAKCESCFFKGQAGIQIVFVFVVSMETVTLCGCVVFISENSDNSEGQMQNTV